MSCSLFLLTSVQLSQDLHHDMTTGEPSNSNGCSTDAVNRWFHSSCSCGPTNNLQHGLFYQEEFPCWISVWYVRLRMWWKQSESEEWLMPQEQSWDKRWPMQSVFHLTVPCPPSTSIRKRYEGNGGGDGYLFPCSAFHRISISTELKKSKIWNVTGHCPHENETKIMQVYFEFTFYIFL